jgi:3-methyl-2-oxobutanoate hydroxymethyltransferase
MSTRPHTAAKLPLPELQDMKRRRDKIVMVTAYDAPGARLADAAGIDLILVGDTAAMVVLGHDSTVPVTLDEMLFLTRSVVRAAKRPLIVGDMPFGTYEASDEEAVHSAVRFVKEGGADVVKLEGAGPSLSRVRAITAAGIGVMGHVGLTPQSATVLGGFKAQGRTAAQAQRLYEDALELQRAGCFAIVLEAVPAAVARAVTRALEVPTIGIGAGAECDGQVLVYHDLLGLYEGRAPRFVKRYAAVGAEIRGALERYAAEVREGRFPEEQHTYSIPDEELAEFEAELAEELQGNVRERG